MATMKTIGSVDLFQELPKERLKAIAKLAKEVKFSRGELLFNEGTRAEKLYVLLEGRIALRIQLSSRPTSVTVAIIENEHHSLGWSGMVHPHYYTASALCERDCKLLAIPSSELLDLLKQEPESGFIVMSRIAQVIADRLRNSRLTLVKAI